MTKPLGMLAFKDTYGHLHHAEVTDISRIVNLREAVDNPGRRPTRSIVKFRSGTEVESTDTANLLIGCYHDIINASPPKLESAEDSD